MNREPFSVTRTFTAPQATEEQRDRLRAAMAALSPELVEAALALNQLFEIALRECDQIKAALFPAPYLSLIEQRDRWQAQRFQMNAMPGPGVGKTYAEVETQFAKAASAVSAWEATPEGVELQLSRPDLERRLQLYERISKIRMAESEAADEEVLTALAELFFAIENLCVPCALEVAKTEITEILRGVFVNENVSAVKAGESPFMRAIIYRWKPFRLRALDTPALVAEANATKAQALAILAGNFTFDVTVKEDGWRQYHEDRREKYASDLAELEEEIRLDNERVEQASAAAEEKLQEQKAALLEFAPQPRQHPGIQNIAC